MANLFEAIRQLVLRGREIPGLYSCESWQCAPNEPVPSKPVQKAQHYGFNSEPPEGALVVSVGINGSSGHHTSVADFLADDPHGELKMGEVQLWSRTGQRLQLLNDGRIVISTPAVRNQIDIAGNVKWAEPVTQTGGSLVLDDDTVTLTGKLAVTGDAAVGRDLMVHHVVGASSGTLTIPFPNVTLTDVTVEGDDTAFELDFTVPSSGPGLNTGTAIAVVQLGRAYASIPRCVASATSDAWTTPPAISARALTSQFIEVRWQGNALTGDDVQRKVTVFVRG